ncbi:MAG: PKD domain-containing protein, partial [Saprospiraceae bacterium]|nr:PKD domain-containing protein [Saprospiraceae bacterium]
RIARVQPSAHHPSTCGGYSSRSPCCTASARPCCSTASACAPTGTRPYLYQYDLSVPDMAASRDTINILDSADYHFPSNITWEKFLGAELGPDGRIYIVHSGLGYNTVQYPNLKGRDCKLVDDKPFFGVVIGSAIPYMPNYRLGPLDGSPCDTLGLNNIPVANFRVDDTLGFLSRYFYDLSHHEPATWFWDFGDGTISQDTSPVHLFPAPGTYTVCLRVCNDYACDTLCREVTVGASGTTETAADPAGYHLYPNPASSSFTLQKTSGFFTGGEPVVMYNSTGQVLATRQPARGETSLVFGVESYPPGVYWLRVEGVVIKVLRMAGF